MSLIIYILTHHFYNPEPYHDLPEYKAAQLMCNTSNNSLPRRYRKGFWEEENLRGPMKLKALNAQLLEAFVSPAEIMEQFEEWNKAKPKGFVFEKWKHEDAHI